MEAKYRFAFGLFLASIGASLLREQLETMVVEKPQAVTVIGVWNASTTAKRIESRRVALITVYQLGHNGAQLPPYMNFWAEACGFQAAVTDCILVLVISDESDVYSLKALPSSAFSCRGADDTLPGNLRVIVYSHSDWATLMLRTTGIVAQPLNNTVKQGDYRVLYGSLFEDVLDESVYSHFGFIDPDTILGNLMHFTDNLSLDIYTAYFRGGAGPPTTAGQITIYRNSQDLRELWRSLPDVKLRMCEAQKHGYDETHLGEATFRIASDRGYTFKHDLEAFSDANEPFLDDFYFEEGRVFAVAKCDQVAASAPREGAYIHVYGIKSSPLSRSCDFLSPSRSWRLPRWNISGAPASFNYDRWGVC